MVVVAEATPGSVPAAEVPAVELTWSCPQATRLWELTSQQIPVVCCVLLGCRGCILKNPMLQKMES